MTWVEFCGLHHKIDTKLAVWIGFGLTAPRDVGKDDVVEQDTRTVLVVYDNLEVVMSFFVGWKLDLIIAIAKAITEAVKLIKVIKEARPGNPLPVGTVW